MLCISFYIELSKDNIRIITKPNPNQKNLKYHTILLLFNAFFIWLHIATITIIFELPIDNI